MKNAMIFAVLFLVLATTASAQSSSFNYQGKLNYAGATADGTFQFQFKLFDQPTGGAQIGAVVSDNAVNVSNGVFSVNLDFGAAAFPGADRYLEITVRQSAAQTFETLTPRQKVNSAPYAIKATAGGANVGGANT